MKKNKRSRTKYPALNKRLNLKARHEQLSDFDYINGYHDPETGMGIRPLNEEEKKFLNDFIEEEINANLNHPGKQLNTDPEDHKRIYNNNNARNRCILSRAKARGRVLGMDEIPPNQTDDNNVEDNLIERIDLKKILSDNKGDD